jgi:hypothetical protein
MQVFFKWKQLRSCHILKLIFLSKLKRFLDKALDSILINNKATSLIEKMIANFEFENM